MKAPWIVYAAIYLSVLPALAALVYRKRLTPPRRWMLAWSIVIVVGNALSVVTAWSGLNNHWIEYLVPPLAGACALWGFSLLQISAIAGMTFRLMIPCLGIIWTLIVIFVEDTDTFSLLAGPFAGLLLLSAAVYTLVSRIFRETGKVADQDWLWLSAGLALYSGIAVALPPTAHMLLAKSPALVVRAYEVKSLFEIVAYTLVARGMACPIPAWRSGGSSSRAPSPSPSSLPASSSRS